MQHLRAADKIGATPVPEDVRAARALELMPLHAIAAILRPAWWADAEVACPACQSGEASLLTHGPRARLTNGGWSCVCGAGGSRRALIDLLLRDPDLVAQLATLEAI